MASRTPSLSLSWHLSHWMDFLLHAAENMVPGSPHPGIKISYSISKSQGKALIAHVNHMLLCVTIYYHSVLQSANLWHKWLVKGLYQNYLSGGRPKEKGKEKMEREMPSIW